MKERRADLLRAAGAIGLALLAGCAAPGAVIRGKVSVTDPGAAMRRGLDESPGGRASLRDAVVFLDSLPAAAARKLPQRPTPQLAVGTRGFSPREVMVARGGSVVLANRDERWHRPFSISASKAFELVSLSPGERRVLRFDRTGVVRVFCRFHDEPSALVFVVPTQVWVHPDATGTFTLPPLPPGEYRVGYWHPRYGERSQRVLLTRQGTLVRLRF